MPADFLPPLFNYINILRFTCSLSPVLLSRLPEERGMNLPNYKTTSHDQNVFVKILKGKGVNSLFSERRSKTR